MKSRHVTVAVICSIVGIAAAIAQAPESAAEPLSMDQLERAAIEATGCRPSKCSAEVFNGFFNPWTRHQVFRVAHTHAFRVAAVSDDGSALLLSGDTVPGEQGVAIRACVRQMHR